MVFLPFPIGLSEQSTTVLRRQNGGDLSSDSSYPVGSNDATGGIHPTPTVEERAEALRLITTLFKERYSDAKSREQKRKLAEDIFAVGLETHDDVAGMFVLLRIARDMAIDVGDIQLAEKIVGSIGQRFQVDPLLAKLNAFDAIEQNLIERSAKEYHFFASLKLAERFESQDAHERAIEACQIAADSAYSLRNAQLMKGVKARLEQLDQTSRRSVAVEKFVTRQALDASDAEANYQVGKYLCFWKGRWNRGLSMLAAGTDPSTG